MTNNIAAGAPYAGFAVPGHDCGDYSDNTFKNNVAHSINGGGGGQGAIIFPNPDKSHGGCFEASYFTAYKNKY